MLHIEVLDIYRAETFKELFEKIYTDNERKLENLKELGKFMKDKKTRDPSQEQLLHRRVY